MKGRSWAASLRIPRPCPHLPLPSPLWRPAGQHSNWRCNWKNDTVPTRWEVAQLPLPCGMPHMGKDKRKAVPLWCDNVAFSPGSQALGRRERLLGLGVLIASDILYHLWWSSHTWPPHNWGQLQEWGETIRKLARHAAVGGDGLATGWTLRKHTSYWLTFWRELGVLVVAGLLRLGCDESGSLIKTDSE